MTETAVTPLEEDAEHAAGPVRPGFQFAKRHQLLVDGEQDGKFRVLCGPKAQVTGLVELRRHLERPLQLDKVSAEQFDALLASTYEQGSSEAMQMMEDMGEELDLLRLAEQLGEPEDLLESEDDAPIIRLINALLTEAVKENASDIHIEPFENRWWCASA